MSVIETTPEETNDRIISSIINWVCPRCGGHMVEYQCCGRCRRNWLPEWEWANYAKTKSAGSSGADASRRQAASHIPAATRLR